MIACIQYLFNFFSLYVGYKYICNIYYTHTHTYIYRQTTSHSFTIFGLHFYFSLILPVLDNTTNLYLFPFIAGGNPKNVQTHQESPGLVLIVNEPSRAPGFMVGKKSFLSRVPLL